MADMRSESEKPDEAVRATRPAPPRIPAWVTVGVTGHRGDAMAGGALDALPTRLGKVLGAIKAQGAALFSREADCFEVAPPRFRIVSPLADGADQLAAEAALAAGYELQAVLPFAREDYASDFPAADARARFEASLARAACILELPGNPANALEAYVMAGRATVAHCDILIAVWDGLPARGRGGTGEVVTYALENGTPILHLPVDEAAPVRILWSGFDPHVVTSTRNADAAERPFDDATLDALMTSLLAPPSGSRERGFLKTFARERERNLRARIEYPMMLALTGVRPFRKASWRSDPYAAATRAEWSPFREDCATGHGVAADLDRLEQAYAWSDRLAQHFAQTYRSGHIFNFLLGAAAVLIALTGLLIPQGKLVLAVAEFAVILAVIANTRAGRTTGWHRRWLDYRQLAERLRPMRTLKLLGLAAPDRPQSRAGADIRWVDWYAAGMWRAIGCPSGKIDADRLTALAKALTARELAPQIAYHRTGAAQVAKLDHRLHVIGTSLFAATIVGCIALIAGYVLFPAWTSGNSAIFVFLSAGLPALGTAIFGIRVQGDFIGTAERSRATADELEAIAEALAAGDIGLARAGDLFEQAARAMLADLGEWRLAHQQHELSVA